MLSTDLISAYTVTEEVWMVPCIIKKNAFEPLSKPLDLSVSFQSLQTRQTWQGQEDEQLREIVETRGPKGWSTIALELNKRVHRGIPVRQGKQCRERYFNHLDPNLKREKWTTEEDLIVMENQQQIGNKWSEISKLLPGRTENQVKNRFKGLLKKGKKGCPKGINPIAHLISLVKTPESKLGYSLDQRKLDNSLDQRKLDDSSDELTPSTFMSHCYGDYGFSTLADRITSYIAPSSPENDEDGSPSAMLFFHSE